MLAARLCTGCSRTLLPPCLSVLCSPPLGSSPSASLAAVGPPEEEPPLLPGALGPKGRQHATIRKQAFVSCKPEERHLNRHGHTLGVVFLAEMADAKKAKTDAVAAKQVLTPSPFSNLLNHRKPQLHALSLMGFFQPIRLARRLICSLCGMWRLRRSSAFSRRFATKSSLIAPSENSPSTPWTMLGRSARPTPAGTAESFPGG